MNIADTLKEWQLLFEHAAEGTFTLDAVSVAKVLKHFCCDHVYYNQLADLCMLMKDAHIEWNEDMLCDCVQVFPSFPSDVPPDEYTQSKDRLARVLYGILVQQSAKVAESPKVINALIDRLHGDCSEIDGVLEQLPSTPVVVEALKQATHNDALSDEQRGWVLSLFRCIPQGFDFVLELLPDKNHETEKSAIDALIWYGDDTIVCATCQRVDEKELKHLHEYLAHSFATRGSLQSLKVLADFPDLVSGLLPLFPDHFVETARMVFGKKDT